MNIMERKKKRCKTMCYLRMRSQGSILKDLKTFRAQNLPIEVK